MRTRAQRLKDRIARLPIRLKLALAYAGVMAAVLAGTGLLIYLSFEDELDSTIDSSVTSQAAALASLVSREGAQAVTRDGPALFRRQEGFAQILDARARVLEATPQVRGLRLLTSAEFARAQHGNIMVTRHRLPNVGKSARIAAEPVAGTRLIVVVGRSQKIREHAIESLVAALLLGIPLGLALASLAGYAIAATALRPVERMRQRAETLSMAEPGARLPVPDTGDEIAALGETLNDMLARLERSFASERALTTKTHHELRAPLAILKSELESAVRRKRPVEEMEAALRSAAEETDRLAQLAEDLLVVARADQGKLPVFLSDTDLSEIVNRLGEPAGVRAQQLGRELDVLARRPCHVRADPEQVTRALDNMLDNALTYGDGRVRIFTVARNGSLELHVTDEGAGFPDDFLPRAFERFSRADTSDGGGGAGFGLAIVEAVAHAHGGTAAAANRPNGGADVWISLPAAHAD